MEMVRCTTVVLVFLFSLAPRAWGATHLWQHATAVDLAPRSSAVVLVHQRGVDLGVQVRSDSGVVLEQDGPDPAFGTEVVVLENRSEVLARYRLLVKTIFTGETARYRIERIDAPTRDELAIARAVSNVSVRWLQGQPAASVLPLATNTLQLAPGRLGGIPINMCLDILVRSGRSADVIDFLRKPVAADAVAPADSAYRDYQLATALWESGRLEPAYELISVRAKDNAASEQWRHVDAPIRRWLDINTDLTLGATRLFVGRARGDRALMQAGGDLLAATLRATNPDTEPTLRARATEYLAGYYNFILDRSSNVLAEMYRQAAQLYESAGDRLSLSVIRNNQAYAQLGRGNIDAALRLYLETLDLQKTSRHIEGQAHVRARLAYLYYTIGDYRRAEVRFKESIELYRQIKVPLKLIHTELQLAELLRSDGRADEALALLNQIRVRHAAQLSIEDRVRLATQRAAIHAERGELRAGEAALADLDPLDRFDSRHWSALQVSVRMFFLLDLEIVRARLELAADARGAAESRVENALVWLGDSHREPLQQLQLLQLQLTMLHAANEEERLAKTGERALALIESVRGSIDFHTQGPAWSARTNNITDLLVSHYLARYDADGKRADFDRAFAMLEGARARNLRDMRAADLADERDEASERADRELQQASQALVQALVLGQPSEPLARRLAKAEEQYQRVLGAQRPKRAPLTVLGAEDVRRRLDAHTEVRVLFAGTSQSYVVALTADAIDISRLPSAGELTTRIQAANIELEDRDRDLARTRELARLLFPAFNRRSPSRLLIETTGVFSAVPFSILLDLQAAGASPPAVTVVPSLSELFGSSDTVRRPPVKERKELVVFADPAFGSSGTGGGDSMRGGFSRLPYSNIEAQSIASYFGDTDVMTFSDKDATIANITDEPARTAKLLHIAAHGFGSASDPFLVGLGLAKDDEGGDSGLLTTRHIASVRYENELIVVSACDSGQGTLLDGEGLMSVARSFLASGAKATLSTLWPVPDRANAEFMKEFYYSLTQLHSDPATSLVRAQQKMKSSRQFSHPYYWGGFVLHVADGGYRPFGGVASARP